MFNTKHTLLLVVFKILSQSKLYQADSVKKWFSPGVGACREETGAVGCTVSGFIKKKLASLEPALVQN